VNNSFGIPEKTWVKWENHARERTKKHIGLYKKYMDVIYPERDNTNHDLSKFTEDFWGPYVLINAKYNFGFKPNEDQEKAMALATYNHILTEDHHPEFWAPEVDYDWTAKDRTKNVKMCDCRGMPDACLIKAVADWCAMSEEIGENTPMDWINNQFGKRWVFTPKQKRFSLDIAEKMWKDEEL